MTVKEIIPKLRANKIHITDQLNGEEVVIDCLEPGSLQKLQRFLHCQVVQLEPVGQDIKILVTLKVKGG